MEDELFEQIVIVLSRNSSNPKRENGRKLVP
jgi:hypothetical protein